MISILKQSFIDAHSGDVPTSLLNAFETKLRQQAKTRIEEYDAEKIITKP